ncbi:hypothetical protein Tco_0588654 [Tanacetum coccineum]
MFPTNPPKNQNVRGLSMDLPSDGSVKKLTGSGTANVIARRAIDEIAKFSGETETLKYMKVFSLQEIAETRRFIRVQREEAQIVRRGLFRSRVAEYGARYAQVITVHTEDDSFTKLMRDLCLVLRISLSKKRRLVAELEALGEREGAAKPLEHMRDIVAHDAVTLEELETLLARAQVGVSLKAGYVADMEENE